jgi:cytidine deaminase
MDGENPQISSFEPCGMCLQVLSRYKSLLKSENYVTRRMSLKLLGELLLDRSNFTIM